jgi:hypothetical protein
MEFSIFGRQSVLPNQNDSYENVFEDSRRFLIPVFEFSGVRSRVELACFNRKFKTLDTLVVDG